MLREKYYELKNWKNVIHTTWNPQGPGVIRIHMIPPKFSFFHVAPSIVILNGQDILPLNESWAILLTEFIHGVNEFGSGEMTQEELQGILQDTFHRVREVYARQEESQETQLSNEEIYQVVKDAVEFCYANGMEINFTSPGWIEEEKLKKLGLDVPSCGACLSNMAITPDGKVIPCQSWLSGEVLGDMRADKWSKIWNHSVCKKNRAFSAKMEQICPLRGKESGTV